MYPYPPTKETIQEWSAYDLAEAFVKARASLHLGAARERNPCVTLGHEALLEDGQNGVKTLHPSLATKRGIYLFYDGDVVALRNILCFGEPIEELVKTLTDILERHNHEWFASDELELILHTNISNEYPFERYDEDGDNNCYYIAARYKDWESKQREWKKAQKKAAKAAFRTAKKAIKRRSR